MNTDKQILIVDDNPEIRQIIHLLLEKNKYRVVEASNGIEAIQLLDPSIQLIIMDIMMPEMDGIQCCKEIRKKSHVPILFLTAKSQIDDMRSAYLTGGDDYLTKPFEKNELLLKVQSLIRRYCTYQDFAKTEQTEIQKIRHLSILPDTMELFYQDQKIELTQKETDIFQYLYLHRHQIISNQELFEQVWEEAYLKSSDNTIMVHMLKLRRKIELDPNKPEIITTVWGKGYRID